MLVFLHEFLTGGGAWGWGSDIPAGSLLAEGRAMAAALAEDLCRIAGVQVVATRDARLEPFTPNVCTDLPIRGEDELERTISRWAAKADWSIIIAPEIDGQLLRLTHLVVASAGRLLGPGPRTMAIASDKQATVDHLLAHGVPVPMGMRLEGGQAVPAYFPRPCVWKPLDGAGSIGIRWIGADQREAGPSTNVGRIEQYCEGVACSCAVLAGPQGAWPLIPCRQRVNPHDHFAYKGGSLPLPGGLAGRAAALALRAVRSFRDARGYVGVDMVLGEDPRGSGDVVIEVNPRLTTSYVGLRACGVNVALAMIQCCQGDYPVLGFQVAPISFTPDGRVTRESSP